MGCPAKTGKDPGRRCNWKKLYYRETKPIVKEGKEANEHWTAWFNNGKNYFAECGGDKLVVQIQTKDDYGENVSIKCASIVSDYIWSGAAEMTDWFTTPSKQMCPQGYFVYRMECRKKNCKEMRLGCHGIRAENLSSAELVRDDWKVRQVALGPAYVICSCIMILIICLKTNVAFISNNSFLQDYYALPSNNQLLGGDRDPTQCPAGTEVLQDECHLAGLVSNRQWGKPSVDWTKSPPIESISERPCGCYIDTAEDYNIHFNSRSNGCMFQAKSRSVCKVRRFIIHSVSNITQNRVGAGTRVAWPFIVFL